MTIDISSSMAIFGAIEGEFIVVSGFERVKNYSDQLGLLQVGASNLSLQGVQVFEGPFSCSTGLLRVYGSTLWYGLGVSTTRIVTLLNTLGRSEAKLFIY